MTTFCKIVNGKFKMFQCTQRAGKGWYHVHEDGTKREPAEGESLEDFYEHPCDFSNEDCGGLGFNIVVNK